MVPSFSVCPVLMATIWRVVCVDSTVHCGHTLQMTVPADAVLPIVTFAQMTGPVLVSYWLIAHHILPKKYLICTNLSSDHDMSSEIKEIC